MRETIEALRSEFALPLQNLEEAVVAAEKGDIEGFKSLMTEEYLHRLEAALGVGNEQEEGHVAGHEEN
jgi:hypothetical protein